MISIIKTKEPLFVTVIVNTKSSNLAEHKEPYSHSTRYTVKPVCAFSVCGLNLYLTPNLFAKGHTASQKYTLTEPITGACVMRTDSTSPATVRADFRRFLKRHNITDAIFKETLSEKIREARTEINMLGNDKFKTLWAQKMI